MSVLGYILIAIGFTLQIYFDFSGYSDMAIGIGKMLGFKFLENFNYPFIANSITEFWRRWHISLSSFLKDYVYIPLGGNRVGALKQIRNIFVVWFLTGFWHGAAWNFIIWGLYFGIILVIEKKFLLEFLKKHKIISHIYTMFLVIISFVIFNANSFTEVTTFMKNMFGFNNLPFITQETIYYLKSYLTMIIIASIASTPLLKNICLKLKENTKIDKVMNILEIIFIFTILILVTAFLIDSSFNPFLYFRF
jgi:alginate O-acetyltransferase complex protein AlgI